MQTTRENALTLTDRLRLFFVGSETEEAQPSALSPILMLLLSPFIALAYLVFLPLVGFAMIFWLMARPITKRFRRVEEPTDG